MNRIANDREYGFIEMASSEEADLDGLYSSDEDEWQEKNIRGLVRTRSVEDNLAPLIVQVKPRIKPSSSVIEHR